MTFATHLAASSRSECQIQNSTRNLYLLVVRFKHSQKILAEMGSECLNWTTSKTEIPLSVLARAATKALVALVALVDWVSVVAPLPVMCSCLRRSSQTVAP